MGTVFVGLSAPEGVTVRHLTLGGDRERIRTLSAHHAFDMLRRYLPIYRQKENKTMAKEQLQGQREPVRQPGGGHPQGQGQPQ